MKKEFKILLACISYFTRIPTWKYSNLSSVDMKQASKYFPFIGWLVGSFSALVYFLSSKIFPNDISIVLSMITSILLTGALHEDGFADFCDGFGGGFSKERILEIMKDSSSGVFGVIALISILTIKFLALSHIPNNIIIPTIIVGHTISRWTSISFLFTHKYARSDENSKSTVFVKKTPIKEFIIISILGIIPFLLFPKDKIILVLSLVVPIYFMKFILGRYMFKKIGGYTGDCMGATQQIAEVILYLGIISIL